MGFLPHARPGGIDGRRDARRLLAARLVLTHARGDRHSAAPRVEHPEIQVTSMGLVERYDDIGLAGYRVEDMASIGRPGDTKRSPQVVGDDPAPDWHRAAAPGDED